MEKHLHTRLDSPEHRFLRHPAGFAAHRGYLWLILGTICSLFAANGHWDLPLAAWLGPLFLLHFTRVNRTRIGLVGVWLASVNIMLFFFYESQTLIPVMIVAGIIFGTILALPYLLDRLLVSRLGLVSGLLATLVFPLSRVACEYLISLTPFGSIFSLAYTQYGNLPLLQIISVTGIYGVSFLMAWFASVGNWIWEQKLSWPRIRVITLLYGGVLTLVLLGGSVRLAFFSPPAQAVRVAGISVPASLLQREKRETGNLAARAHNPALLRSAFATVDNALLDLSMREARAGAKIIVWPEVGAVTLAADETKLIGQGQALARQENIYLDMGVGVFQPPATFHDETILIDPQGQAVWTYQKAHPVPGLDNFAPGNGIVPIANTPDGRLANVICFDADFPDLMRQGGSASADIVLVPGNDWAGIDPWHTQHATFRAIENGYSLVRQASNGLAMTVDYEGHVLSASDYFTVDQQAMIAYVPTKGVWTIYAHVGDLFTWLCIASLLFMAGFVVFTSSRKHLRTSEALPDTIPSFV